MSAPLLFLDVDGVVLPLGAEPDDLRDDLGRTLSALPADLVWATAWEHSANIEIAPRIGLPRIPVVEWHDPTTAELALDAHFDLHWKTRQIVEWAHGRDFAWADDEVTTADQDWIAQNHPGRALVHHVRALLGLTTADFETLRRWLRGKGVAEADGDGDGDGDSTGGGEGQDDDADERRPAAS